MSLIESPAVALSPTQQHALEQLPSRVAEALLRFRDNLLARFPDQIKHVILYGSFARGEAHEESDIDVMVVVSWEEERSPDGWYRSHYGDPHWEAITNLSVDATLACERFVEVYALGEARFNLHSDVAVEARREGLELLNARLSGGRLVAGRVDTEAGYARPDRSRSIREGPPAGDEVAREPADLSQPRTWLFLADEKLGVARDLARDAHYDDALSKAYYAVFYGAKAALLSIGVKVKSHSGAISEFGRRFVTTGRVDQRFSAIHSSLSRARLRSDYDPYPRVDKRRAEQAIRDAETFTARARELVEEELSSRGAFPA
jgi:uncharacterized protein (UPF0332 family)/predicted nucleotidyltransferase